MRSLAVAALLAGSLEVIIQVRLIFRIRNLIDNDRSFFFRGQAAQVSNAAFGNDNVNVQGCMVDMAAERNYGADLAALGQGVGEEYGQVAVTCKVAGTANTVHQLGAANMGGVYVAVNVNFDCSVHGDNADTTCNFGAVGNFLRTEQQIFLIEIYVFIEFLLAFRRRSQGSAGSNPQFAGVDQVEHAVLNNFGVNGQVFEVGVNQAVDNSVGYRAYTRLQRQQVGRQTAFRNFLLQEVNQVLAHMFRIFVDFAQRTNFIGDVAGNYSYDLIQFAGDVRSADTVFRFFNRNWFTVRRIQRNIGVMHAFQAYRLGSVNFNDYFRSGSYIRGAVAHGSGGDQAYFAVAQVIDLADFNDSEIDLFAVSHEAITGHLCEMGQMNVGIANFAGVDSFTQGCIGLIRQAAVHAAGINHSSVNFRAYRCAGPNVNFKRSLFCFFSQSQRHSLRIAGRSKAADAEAVAVFNHFSSFFSSFKFANY